MLLSVELEQDLTEITLRRLTLRYRLILCGNLERLFAVGLLSASSVLLSLGIAKTSNPVLTIMFFSKAGHIPYNIRITYIYFNLFLLI